MALKRAIFVKQASERKLKSIDSQKQIKKGPIGIEQESFAKREPKINVALSKIGDNAKVLLKEEGSEYLREMCKEDMNVLLNPLEEVNDNIIFISLR